MALEWDVVSEDPISGGAPSFADVIRTHGERSPANAVSPKGARSEMQVMGPTAEEPGYGVTPAADDSLEETDRVGVDYANAMLEEYGGSWGLAAAAYNAGPGQVEDWFKQIGDPRKGEISEEEFVSKLPFQETRDYVGRVLAARGQPQEATAPGKADPWAVVEEAPIAADPWAVVTEEPIDGGPVPASIEVTPAKQSDMAPDNTFFGEMRKAFASTVPTTKEMIGGRGQLFGQAFTSKAKADQTRNVVRLMAAGKMTAEEGEQEIRSINGWAVPSAALGEMLAEEGEKMATAGRAEQEPLKQTVAPLTFAGVIGNVIRSSPYMAESLAAALTTRGAGGLAARTVGMGAAGQAAAREGVAQVAGLTSMFTSTAGQKYAEARAEGRTPEQALQDAGFYGISESIPEMLPFGSLFKEGPSLARRVISAIVGEGASEEATEAAQIAYEKNALDKKIPIGEVLFRLGYAPLVGGTMGAGMAVATHPFVTPEKPAQEVPEPEHIDPTLGPDTAPPAAQPAPGAPPAAAAPPPQPAPPPEPAPVQQAPHAGLQPIFDPDSHEQIGWYNKAQDTSSVFDHDTGKMADVKGLPEGGVLGEGEPAPADEAKELLKATGIDLAEVAKLNRMPNGKVSVSHIQRTFSVGYNQAVKISDMVPPIEGTSKAPIKVETPEDMPAVEQAKAAEPKSQAQAEAGNSQKVHIDYAGFASAIETNKGEVRRSKDPENQWESPPMPAPYGYIKKADGADGDKLDAFFGPNPQSENVFVIHQQDAKTAKFDEHKVMLGYDSEDAALNDYFDSFSDGGGPSRLQGVEALTLDQFRKNVDKNAYQKPPAPKKAFTTTPGKIATEHAEEVEGQIAKGQAAPAKPKTPDVPRETEPKKAAPAAAAGPTGDVARDLQDLIGVFTKDGIEAAKERFIKLAPGKTEHGLALKQAFKEWHEEREFAAAAKPGERPVDSKLKPIYRQGERVAISGTGDIGGRRGVIAERHAFTTKPIFGPGKTETSFQYIVKTDQGFQAHVSPDEMSLETDAAPDAIPDPVYKQRPVLATRLQGDIALAKSNAKKMRERAERARKPGMIRQHQKDAQRHDEDAAEIQRILDTWAEKYPEEAARVLRKKAEPAKHAANAAPAADAPENIAKMRRALADLKARRFKTASDEAVIELYERRLSADPSKWKVGDGITYSVASSGRTVQWNRGFRIAEVSPESLQALVVSVADTGLTSTGGNQDRVQDEWVYLGDMRRDTKYDATERPSDAPPDAPKPAGATVKENEQHDGVEVRFPAKPPAPVMQALKAAGFRWSSQGFWYGKRTPERLKLAYSLAGKEPPAPKVAEEPKAEPTEKPKSTGILASNEAEFREKLDRYNDALYGERVYMLRKTPDGRTWVVHHQQQDGGKDRQDKRPDGESVWSHADALEQAVGIAFPKKAEQAKFKKGDAVRWTVNNNGRTFELEGTISDHIINGFTRVTLTEKPPRSPYGIGMQLGVLVENLRHVPRSPALQEPTEQPEPSQLAKDMSNMRSALERAGAARTEDADYLIQSQIVPGGFEYHFRVTTNGNRVTHGEREGWSRGKAIDNAVEHAFGERKPTEQPKPKTETKPQPAKGPRDWTEIGKNAIGQTLYQDQRGVRSYVENGVRRVEPVGMVPTREGVQISVNRGENPEYALESEPEAEKLRKPAPAPTPAPKPSALTAEEQDEYAALQARLKAKLKGQASAGLDPEVLQIGVRMTVLNIKSGVRRFVAVARKLSTDLGASLKELRPYLRSWYNGARDQMEDSGLDISGMDDADAVRAGLAEIDTAIKAEEDGVPGTLPTGLPGAGPEGIQPTPAKRPDGRAPETENGGGLPAPGPTAGPRAEGQKRPSEGPSGTAGGGGTSLGVTPGVPQPGSRGPGATKRPEDAGVRGTDYRIEPGEIAEGRGPKAKAHDNLAAIRLIKALKQEGRLKNATRAEQSVLVKYVGWGGLRTEFEDDKIGKELRDLLTDEEYRTAARSTQYAHYTAEHIVRSMWDAVSRMGFKGGSVFEPGMGIGHFVGMMPADIAAASKYQGIEMDHLTAEIATALYPESGVRRADYTETPIPDNTFDIVIGNPPFADIPIESDPKYKPHKFFIHDYFFAKSMDALRPGGIMAFITSAGTMNKIDTAARAYLGQRAEFIGGVRLPSTAFKKNAGTEVTTDILFFQKRQETLEPKEFDTRFGQGAPDAIWASTDIRELPNAQGGTDAGHVSHYFSEHPELVLGEEGFFDKLYKGRYGVHARPDEDLETSLAHALSTLPSDIYIRPDTAQMKAEKDFASDQTKDGTFYLKDGKVWQYNAGAGEQVNLRSKAAPAGMPAGDYERVTHLIPIRDALREVYRADLADNEDGAKTARKALNKAYDTFLSKFGPINKATFQYQRPSRVQEEVARAQAREESRARSEAWDDGDFDAGPLMAQRAIEDIEEEDPDTGEKKKTKNKGPTWAQIAKARQEARDKAKAAGRTFNEGTFNPDEMPDVVIERRPNVKAFMADPESYRLRSIEDYNEQTGESKKRRVFTESVLTRETEPDIKSAQDGVMWSLNKFGRLDLEAIARQRGQSKDEVVAELGDFVFRIPGTIDTYQSADEYLSGDVLDKLAEAKKYAEIDPQFQRNADALEAAKPQPLPPAEIRMSFGMPWIPSNLVDDFAREVGLGRVTVKHSDVLGGWTVELHERGGEWERWTAGQELDPPAVLREALNRTKPRIFNWVGTGHDRERVFDAVATQQVADKIDELANAFAQYDKRTNELLGGWVMENDERYQALADLYNEKMNRTVPRVVDGSFLTTPGVASDWKWRPHQRRVVARVILVGNTYIGHAVGGGKTSEYIGAGMEMRRLGLINKPMYTVPNIMLAQFTKEFYEQYPLAKIAVADERRFHTSRRKQFIANVAQEDLDAVILTHSAFGKIPLGQAFQNELIQEEIDLIDQALEDLDEQDDRITIRKLENKKEKLEQRMHGAFGGKKDQTFTFEEMGVDFLFVDEAHLFRKLDFASRQSIKGIDGEGSDRSFDLYAKLRYLDSKNPGRSVVMGSGTPITNTMGELYTLSKYMQRQALQKRGIWHFDSWAASFGDVETATEPTAQGTYERVTRFRKFVNGYELYKMVAEVMDIVTSQQLEQYVVRPKIKGGARQTHLAPKTEAYERFQASLVARVQAIKQRRGPPQKGDDILLSVINDGRHAAIDMRFIEYGPANQESKLNLMIDNVFDIWKRTKDTRFFDPASNYKKEIARGPATQMIFSNLGVNPRGERGFSGYRWIKQQLVSKGVPLNEIAFIGDYKSHIARQKLFNDMNAGKIRILVGSTTKMGMGVNAQRRLIALHNLDPLWYPADDEQRIGRGLRQGNWNPELEIHDYSTKGTYDEQMWKLMASKARFIEQFFRGDPTLRTIDDVGEASFYEQASAMAAADERIILLTEMQSDLDRLERQRAGHEREQYGYRQKIARARTDIEHADSTIPKLQKDIAQRKPSMGDDFSMKIGDQTFDKFSDASDALGKKLEELVPTLPKDVKRPLFEIGGFRVLIEKYGKTGFSLHVVRSDGPEYVSSLATTPSGIINAVRDKLDSFEGRIRSQESYKTEGQKRIAELTPLVGKPFAKEAELAKLRRDVRELENQIAPSEGGILMPQNEPENKSPLSADEQLARKDLIDHFDTLTRDQRARLADLNWRHFKGGKQAEQPPAPDAEEDDGTRYSLGRKPPVFFSGLTRAVEQNPQKKGTGKHWLGILANLAGVKKEEVEVSGVSEWLASKSSQPVTKDELVQFLKENEIGIREVTRAGKGTPDPDGDYPGDDLVGNEEPRAGQWRYTELDRISARRELTANEHAELQWLDSFPEASQREVLVRMYDGWIQDNDLPHESADELAATLAGTRDDMPGEDHTVMNAQITWLREFSRKWEAMERAENGGAAREPGANLPTKFASFVLPGGKKYREYLLILPTKANRMRGLTMHEIAERLGYGGWNGDLTEAQKVEIGYIFDGQKEKPAHFEQRLTDAHNAIYEYKRSHRNPAGDMPTTQNDPELRRLTAVESDIREEWDEAKRQTEPFKAGHFPERNVLAHVRVTERTDKDGKRVFFIEEIQSDWHQKGRRYGYRGQLEPDIQKLVDEVRALGVIKDYDTVSLSDLQRAGASEQLLDRWDAAMRARRIPSKMHAMPDAPFKSTWHELALKRMLRHAVDQGFERIAWTTGEQQADRYNLAKRISVLRFTKHGKSNADGIERFTVIAAKDGRVIASKERVPLSEIADFVGKDIADKIDRQDKTEGVLSGLDLKIGGEGMKGFYDQIVPQFLNKYTKKWGAKVGRTEINTGITKNDRWEVYDGDGDGIETFATRAEAEARAEDGDLDVRELPVGGVTVHALDITPAMKDAVQGGQPLFRAGEKEAPKSGRQLETVPLGDMTEQEKELVETLSGIIRRLSPEAEFGFERQMSLDGEEVLGVHQREGMRKIIRLALEGADGQSLPRTLTAGIAGHEMIHWLKANWLITPQEWSILEKAALDGNWIKKHRIDKRYEGWSRSIQIEEAIADEFGIGIGKQLEQDEAVLRIFNKIARFFRNLARALRTMFGAETTAEDIFRKIRSGEVGRRGLELDEESPYTHAEPLFSRPKVIKGGGLGSEEQFWQIVGQVEGEHGKAVANRAERLFDQYPNVQNWARELVRRGWLDEIPPAPQPSLQVVPPGGVNSPAFKRWFGKSKVVNKDGSPKVVYHGTRTSEDFSTFSTPSHFGSKEPADVKASNGGIYGPGRIMPVYLSIQNPKRVRDQAKIGWGLWDDVIEQAKAEGYDGLVYANEAEGFGTESWVAFEPTQIKGQFNAGTFDPNDPDIRLARPRRTPGAAHNIKFDDAATEKRWNEARKGAGVGQSVIAQAQKWMDDVYAGFTRHWVKLPNIPRYADLQQQLFKLEHSPAATTERIIRYLREVVGDLSQHELDLFTRKVVLDDLAYEATRDHQLPFGLVDADIPAELAKVDAELARRPDLVAKIRARKVFVDSVKDQMIRVGVLSQEQAKNPAYYRHQVLEYAQTMRWGARNKLRTPYWAQRKGSEKDINANYLEAEADWLRKALNDIAEATTINWVDESRHNIRRQVIAAAKAHNDRLLNGLIQADIQANGWTDSKGKPTSPLNEVFKKFRQSIAIGFGHIATALKDGSLIPPTWAEDAADAIENGTRDDGVMPFLSWILENNQPGAMGAAMALKAVSGRREFIKDLLAEKYADPTDIDGLIDMKLAPEGYVGWQPEKGKNVYSVKTITQRAAENFISQLGTYATPAQAAAALGLPPNTAPKEVQRALAKELVNAGAAIRAVGGDKYTMVIPAELALTFDALKKAPDSAVLELFFKAPLRAWKQWVLNNPMRTLKYNLNNLSGDIDAVLAGNPRILRKVPQAFSELRNVVIQHEDPTQTYIDAVDRGVFNAGFTLQEIPDINALSEFERLVSRDPSLLGKVAAPVTKPLGAYWRTIRKYTTFRENIVRYAAYLEYLERLERGEPMSKIGYAASLPQMVDAVSDNKDKAALLARDVVGDYGAVSDIGMRMRSTLIPFWSFQEINLKRYWRMTHNAYGQGVGRGLATTGIVGGLLGARVTAYMLTRMVLMYGLIWAWNNLVFGDDEDDLDPEQARQLHVLLGRDSDGQIRSLRIQGAVSDIFSWLGLQDAAGALGEVAAGRGSLLDVLGAVAAAPVKKIVGSITPAIMVPVSMGSGLSFFPDVFAPLPIRDRWRELFRLFSLDPAYDALTGKPQRSLQTNLENVLIYKRDPGETAYDEVRGLGFRWIERTKGTTGIGGATTKRGEALRNWRTAARYGDVEAGKRAVRQMRELRMTPDDIRQSLAAAEPTGMVAARDRGEFMSTLTEREKKRLAQAREWYRDTIIGGGVDAISKAFEKE